MDARDRALKYLGARMCSAHKLKEYLKGKGYEEDEIDKVIAELKEYHYVDDLAYAKTFIEAGYEKGRGIARIRRELKEKGVDAETIAFAEESVEDPPDEKEMALELAKTVVEGIDTDSMEWKEKEALKERVARRLASRGFDAGTIYDVIGRVI